METPLIDPVIPLIQDVHVALDHLIAYMLRENTGWCKLNVGGIDVMIDLKHRSEHIMYVVKVICKKGIKTFGLEDVSTKPFYGDYYSGTLIWQSRPGEAHKVVPLFETEEVAESVASRYRKNWQVESAEVVQVGLRE